MIVPDLVVKKLLMQNELGERRGKWMEILQEFNLEIQPMKLVSGQGLSKIMDDNQVGDERKFRFDNETNVQDQEKMIVSQVDINQGVVTDVWYKDILYYLLQNQCPSWMNSSQ